MLSNVFKQRGLRSVRVYEVYRFDGRKTRSSKVTVDVEGLYKERSEVINLAKDGALLDLLQKSCIVMQTINLQQSSIE